MLKKKRSAAEEEYLGTRATYGITEDGAPTLTIERGIDGRPEWRVALEWVHVDGRFILAEVRFFPAGDRHAYIAEHDDVSPVQPAKLNVGQWSRTAGALAGVRGNGIPARMLREVTLEEIDGTVRSADHSRVQPFLSGRVKDAWSRLIDEQAARPRSAGRDDSFYLGWALRFIGCASEEGYRPYVLMAERYGIRDIQTARNYVDAAKRRGLLKGAGAGRRGVPELTRQGLALKDKIESAAAVPARSRRRTPPSELSDDELWSEYIDLSREGAR